MRHNINAERTKTHIKVQEGLYGYKVKEIMCEQNNMILARHKGARNKWVVSVYRASDLSSIIGCFEAVIPLKTIKKEFMSRATPELQSIFDQLSMDDDVSKSYSAEFKDSAIAARNELLRGLNPNDKRLPKQDIYEV